MKQRSIRKQMGVTLTELLVVVAVGGLILAAFGPKAAELYREFRATNEAEKISRFYAKLNSRFGSDGYAGLTNQVSINNGSVPDDMLKGTRILNEYGLPITVPPASRAGGTNNMVSIAASGYPKGMCAAIVRNAHKNFSEVTVNGTAVKNIGDTLLNNTRLGTACQSRTTAAVTYIGL